MFLGATVSAGFYHAYAQGESIGVMVPAYLNGELDLETTGIGQLRAESLGVMLNLPAEQQAELDG